MFYEIFLVGFGLSIIYGIYDSHTETQNNANNEHLRIKNNNNDFSINN